MLKLLARKRCRSQIDLAETIADNSFKGTWKTEKDTE